MDEILEILTNRLGYAKNAVAGTVKLLGEGATIPFIARYRKEATHGLDEVEISAIQSELENIGELQERKRTIIAQLEQQGVLNPELKSKIDTTWDKNELEDIYLPYRPKRRTRAMIAREAGLEPLAKMIFSDSCRNNVRQQASRFVNDTITSTEQAIEGAKDIIAEWVSEHPTARNIVRQTFERTASLQSKVIKGKEEEAANYSDYFDKQVRLSRCPSHTLLAIRRGENEKMLRVKIAADNDTALQHLNRYFVHSNSECARLVEEAIADGYKRLLEPSIETEFAALSKEKADTEAIRIFADNLQQLLLSSPSGQKRTMGIDPGFRTGCKIVCLDAEGNLLHNDTIFPHPPQNKSAEARAKLSRLAEQYKIEAIAIGNGTAGRETEQLVTTMAWRQPIEIYMVSENGASIYSASAIARKEFPDYDVTVRGAVSIARRLMDPLSELVKIDPKSIGVGQYQHDVDQSQLKKALDRTVEHCVNTVGVELNNASEQLLTYVAGIGPQIAKSIVEHRTQNGAFASRKQLLDVPKLGKKAYEQCAGFIRVAASDNPLDRTAVHPESYHIVKQMASDCHCSVEELISNRTIRETIDVNRYITAETGLPTLNLIMSELEKPGRDPRRPIEQWSFDSSIHTIDDLRVGMTLPGQVTNITNFGAFVNIGIKENGLLHISQITDPRNPNRRLTSPAELLHLDQHIEVTIIGIDQARKRIQLKLNT